VESVRTDNRGGVGEMHKRRTTLADGRYLIYYTFGEEAGESAAEADKTGAAGVDASRRVPAPEPEAEPAAEPEAEEERRV
jgi:hypothetical protein